MNARQRRAIKRSRLPVGTVVMFMDDRGIWCTGKISERQYEDVSVHRLRIDYDNGAYRTWCYPLLRDVCIPKTTARSVADEFHGAIVAAFSLLAELPLPGERKRSYPHGS